MKKGSKEPRKTGCWAAPCCGRLWCRGQGGSRRGRDQGVQGCGQRHQLPPRLHPGERGRAGASQHPPSH
eukprot:6305732-Lingulodinium_polyedra.AAC.1